METTQEAISREFNGLPVKDAEHDLALVITKDDIEGATRMDFGHCVFANACVRQFQSEKVVFMKTVAYIAMPDEDGNKVIRRYMTSKRARKLIEQFDKGEDPDPGCGFYLLAPDGYQKLDMRRKVSQNHRDRKAEMVNTGKRTKEEPEEDASLESISEYLETCAEQEREIAVLFLNNPDLKIGPGSLHKKQGFDWPITSTRRAISNLTEAGVLEKTDEKRMGVFGKQEYLWKASNVSSSHHKKLKSRTEENDSEMSTKTAVEFQVRNGRGKVQTLIAEEETA